LRADINPRKFKGKKPQQPGGKAKSNPSCETSRRGKQEKKKGGHHNIALAKKIENNTTLRRGKGRTSELVVGGR